MSDRKGSRRRSELYRALEKLAQGGGVQRKDLLEALEGELSELRRCWGVNLKKREGVDKEDHRQQVRRTISTNLDVHIRGLTPPRGVPLVRYRYIVYVGFNMIIDQEHASLEDTHATKRLEWLATKSRERYRTPVRTSRRYHESALNQIEQQILEAGYEPVHVHDDEPDPVPVLFPVPASEIPFPTQASHQPSKEQMGDYIGRRAYLKQIAEFVTSGERIISIYGEAGTGKSTLAVTAAHELSRGKPVVTLQVADEKILKGDVVRALRQDGLQPESWSEAYCEAMFQERLESSTTLGVVVVDNVDGLTEARTWSLVPEHPAIPIILTSRKKLRGRSQQAQGLSHVELGEFTEDEAEEFVTRSLSQCDELDRQNLIIALGRRPLALFHAVQFLANTTSVSPAELVEALVDSVSENLSLIEPSIVQTPKLLSLYRLILEDINKEQAACDVLDAFIAATGNSALCDPSLLVFAMRAVFPGATTNIRLQSGLNYLEQNGLIRKDANEWWAMHPLTWKVLRELRGELQNLATLKYLKAIADADATAQDSTEFGMGGGGHAQLLYEELRASADLLPSWRWVLSVDEYTWFTLREWTDGAGVSHETYVRYETLPKGTRRKDLLTGETGWVELEEGRQLLQVARIRNLLVRARYDVGKPNHNEADSGPCILRRYLDADDTAALWRIVMTGKSSLKFFPKARTNFERLVVEAAERLRHLGQAHNLADLDKQHHIGNLTYARQRFWEMWNRFYFGAGGGLWEPDELITYSRWLVDDRERSAAAAMLDSPALSRSLGARILNARQEAEAHALKGRIAMAHGDWARGDEHLRTSLTYFQQQESDEHIALRGTVYSQMQRLDLLLMSGVYDERLHDLERNITRIWYERPEDFSDGLTEARVLRIRARFGIALAVRDVWKRWLAGRSDAHGLVYPSAVRDYLTPSNRCVCLFKEESYLHPEHDEFLIDRAIVAAIEGRLTNMRPIESAIRNDVKTLYAQNILALTAMKLVIVRDATVAGQWSSSHDRLRSNLVPWNLAGKCESAYWYADSLAVACVVNALRGHSYRIALRAAEREYERLGRTDRLAELSLALNALPGSYEEFSRHFAYLLTW